MKMIVRHWEQWTDCGLQKNRDILNNNNNTFTYWTDVNVIVKH